MTLENVVYGKTLQGLYEVFSDETMCYLLKNAGNVDWTGLEEMYNESTEEQDPVKFWFDTNEKLGIDLHAQVITAGLLLYAMGYFADADTRDKQAKAVESAFGDFIAPLTSRYNSFMELCEKREELRAVGKDMRWIDLAQMVEEAVFNGEGLKRKRFDELIDVKSKFDNLPALSPFNENIRNALFGAGDIYESEIISDKGFGFKGVEFRNQYFKKEQ